MSGTVNQNSGGSSNVTASTSESSEVRENIEELQKTMANVNALADTLNTNDTSENQTTGRLLKEIVNRLCKVHAHMLDSEKLKLKSKQASEQRVSVQSQEGLSCNNLAPKIQRQYRLTSKSSYEVWMDCLNTELTSWGLLDLIDPSQPAPTGISETEIKRRKNSVKDIIINHIAEEYHKRILGLTEPLEILKRLRDSRKGEVSSTPTSIRTRLYNLRMSKDERVHKFCERFDQIIREHELSDDPHKLTEQEKRSTFYQAIIGAMPEVRRTDSAVISTTGKEMDMEALRKTMYRIQEDNDANKRSYGEKDVSVSRVTVQKGKSNRNKCFRCNREGHWQIHCPLDGTNQWACYICNGITDHKSENCPRKLKRPCNSNNDYELPVKRNKPNPNQRIRGRGPGNFRGKSGNFRGNTRGNFRGRRGNRGSTHQSRARRAEYDEGSAEQEYYEDGDEQHNESEGKTLHNKSLNSDKYIEFIADSGATSHIINKSFILSNFKKSERGIIKSANKNEIADIVIDGKGNLLLRDDKVNGNHIKLTNVIAAKDISENLLSLRKLVDAGFCIYLDDKIFRVYNKENNKTIFKGIYEKPNWVVRFEVKKPKCTDNNTINEYDNYSCIACLAVDNEVFEQSQTNEDKDMSRSEGVNLESMDTSMVNVGSAIGRESLEDLIVLENRDINSEKLNSEKLNLECKNNLLSYKTVKVDELKSGESLKEILDENPPENSFPTNIQSEAMLWHRRLGHASLNYLKMIQKKDKRLEHVRFNDSIKECEVCILSKMEKLPFKQNRSRADKPLQMIHSDAMGPIKPTSWPGQRRYIIVFVDDYSRYANVYCLKSKDESGQVFEQFLSSARNLLGTDAKVCYVRSDRGTEFTGGKFAEIMKREKIESDSGPPYTPELNGTAERFNKSIQRTIRAYMCDSGLPQSMWELAAATAVHTYNRTPHKSIDYEVPLVKFSPKANCHLEQIRRFGCIAYVKLPFVETKFSNVSIKTVLVGHTSTGYILWHPSTRKFIESRHVRCIERIVYKDVYSKNQHKKLVEESKSDETTEFTVYDETMEIDHSEVKTIEPKKRGRPKKINSEEKSEEQNKEKNSEIPINKTGGPVTRSKAKKIEDISFARYTRISEVNEINEDGLEHILLASIQKDPTNFEEAMNSENNELWKQAIREELDSMEENKVWVLVDRPKEDPRGKRPNIIDSKWVFKKKVESNGSIKYKARLVSRGFKDKNVYGLKETYAPVSRLSLIRAVLSIINKEDLDVNQMDVKTAFLHGELKEEVFMEIPEGLEVPENVKLEKVCKLEKSLYGLIVSPKLWYKKFTEEVRKLGLENDLHDPCLFTWRSNGKLAIVLLYVDDMLIAGNDPEKLNEIKTHLSSVFQMKDLGEPKNFLGMTIHRDRNERSIVLHQAAYTERVLERFNMHESKPQSTPMVTRQVDHRNKKLKSHSENSEKPNEVKRVPFREAIGSLMYLASATRPDIAYAVNYLARNQIDPTEDDWVEVKRVFRYLRGTTDLGIKFLSNSENLEALSDVSFRDCEDSKSTGGYVIKLFGDVITWRSHKQSTVTTSTCQAEYLAMSDACQELISLDKSIRYIIGRTFYPITLWCDNKSARDCTEKDGSHKLKTFDLSVEEIKNELAYREKNGNRKSMAITHGDFVKQCVEEKKIRVCWISTDENLADIMTKPLPQSRHDYLRDKITNTKFR